MSDSATPISKPELFCSFCGKSQHDVRSLIVGTREKCLICNECIQLCVDILAEEGSNLLGMDIVSAEELLADCPPEKHGAGNWLRSLNYKLLELRRPIDTQRRKLLKEREKLEKQIQKNQQDVAQENAPHVTRIAIIVAELAALPESEPLKLSVLDK